jgi:hypothetical protein
MLVYQNIQQLTRHSEQMALRNTKSAADTFYPTGLNVIKLFFFTKKLEGLSLASFSSGSCPYPQILQQARKACQR